MVPKDLQQIKTIELTGKFLLSNAYFKYDTKLIAFEFWANYDSKYISVEVTNSDFFYKIISKIKS